MGETAARRKGCKGKRTCGAALRRRAPRDRLWFGEHGFGDHGFWRAWPAGHPPRVAAERTLTVSTTAAGGNTSRVSLSEKAW